MYGTFYSIPFINREGDLCEVRILQDGWAGAITTLEGADSPFVIQSQAQDSQLPYGVKASEAQISFYAGAVKLTDFYTEDDNFWKIEFYYLSNLTWTGWLQLDNSSEQLTDIDHVITLDANDGIGRLQSLSLLVDQDDLTVPIYAQWKLTELFDYIFGFIGTDLQIAAYLNIFETTTNDRSGYTDTADFLQQTVIDTKYYIASDGSTLTLYEILNSVLTDFRSILFQADGVWNIVRWGEVRLFADGTMPGTLYNSDFTVNTNITYPTELQIGRGLDCHPINENQISRILRPFKYTKEQFDYNQPPFIIQADLRIADGATPYATSTISGFRYDKYSIATYFPFWTQIDGDTSYLEVVTEVATESETERYIVTPVTSRVQKAVRFNPIPVSTGDSFDFSLQFRTPTDIGTTYVFKVRFLLIIPNGTYYYLYTAGSGSDVVYWSGPFADSGWDDFAGAFWYTPASADSSLYATFSISAFLGPDEIMPIFPEDGVLCIEVEGNNDTNVSEPMVTTEWQDINFTVKQFVNFSVNAIGQVHTQTQTPTIKNNLQLTPVHDDSPKYTILGTLYTDAVSTFGALVGDLYFTKTQFWHRTTIAEDRRLGDLNTYVDLFNQRITREIIEGDFYGLANTSILKVINFAFIPDKKFIFGVSSIDYMSCIWNATLYELFTDVEVDGDLTSTYLFNYIYNNG